LLKRVHTQSYTFAVSVQRPNQVKITDFGLAKLLNSDEEEIDWEGGKVSFDQSTYTVNRKPHRGRAG